MDLDDEVQKAIDGDNPDFIEDDMEVIDEDSDGGMLEYFPRDAKTIKDVKFIRNTEQVYRSESTVFRRKEVTDKEINELENE